jgi:hypothetical protein
MSGLGKNNASGADRAGSVSIVGKPEVGQKRGCGKRRVVLGVSLANRKLKHRSKFVASWPNTRLLPLPSGMKMGPATRYLTEAKPLTINLLTNYMD